MDWDNSIAKIEHQVEQPMFHYMPIAIRSISDHCEWHRRMHLMLERDSERVGDTKRAEYHRNKIRTQYEPYLRAEAEKQVAEILGHRCKCHGS